MTTATSKVGKPFRGWCRSEFGPVSDMKGSFGHNGRLSFRNWKGGRGRSLSAATCIPGSVQRLKPVEGFTVPCCFRPIQAFGNRIAEGRAIYFVHGRSLLTEPLHK